MTPQARKLVREITKSFKSVERCVPKKHRDDNGYWTNRIKEELGKLGEKHGYEVCTSGFKDRFSNGWLYDLVWRRNKKRWNRNPREKVVYLEEVYLEEVFLVLESEWSHRKAAVECDFNKILQAKAALKVTVFDGYEDRCRSLLEDLTDRIRQFKKCSKSCGDETYIFAVMNWTKWTENQGFEFYQIKGGGATKLKVLS